MLRKISFALVTAIAVGSAALVPATASPHGFGGGWHGGGYGYGFRSFSYESNYNGYDGYDSYGFRGHDRRR
jgi:hypothetical protein